VPPDSVLRLSPLAALSTMLGGKAFIARYAPAFAVLVLAVLFGRFFCGWVCPLGSAIDTTDNALTRARKGRERSLYDGRRLKYYLLAFLRVGAAVGIRAAGWLDPLSIATRSLGLVVVPYVVWLSNGVALVLQDVPLGRAGEWWARGSRLVLADSSVPTYHQHVVFFVLLTVLLGLGVWYRRYWCRNLCPLGALLGLVSLKHLLKRSVSGACIACHKCERVCPMGCITDDGKGTMGGECILCLRCQEACPKDAIRFARRQPREQDAPVDLTKRGFLTTMGATAAALPFLGINVPRHRTKERLTVLRPPGALPEDEFLARCVRCGECMRVCPTRALQPAAFEAGVEGLWTPRLVPRMGYCVYTCTLCGEVCPSQALQELTLEEKQTRSLGKAKFDRSRCIPWRGHARFREGLEEWKDCNCGTCEEACPVPGKAIRYNRFVGEVGGKKIVIDRPYVVEELCVGCGFCENVCPVPGDAAIRVEGPGGTACIAEEAEASAVDPKQLFPAEIAGWKLEGKPRVYVGPTQLFEYINGAGEPYLTYAFLQVAAGVYKQGEMELHVDLWYFKTPEEAFGAYSRDCSSAATAPEKLGHASGSAEGELWVWSGINYLHVTSLGSEAAPYAQIVAVATVVLARAPGGEAKLPPVVAALPAKSRDPVSIHYFHDKLAAPDFLPSELVGAGGFAIAAATPAAFARYVEADKPLYNIVVVEYPSEAAAEAALQRCLELCSTKPVAAKEDGLTFSQVGTNALTAFVPGGTRIGAVVRAGNLSLAKEAAAELKRSLTR
jgi:polyferredoxin